jgi:glycosyltransferase involved in cell wall biosynthesis
MPESVHAKLKDIEIHFLPFSTTEAGGASRNPRTDLVLFSLFSSIVSAMLISSKKINVLHERAMPFQLVGTILSKLFSRPLVLEVNGLLLDELVVLGRLKEKSFLEHIGKRIYQTVLRAATFIIFVSKYVCNKTCAEYSIDEQRCVVIHNGVDVDLFSPANGSRKPALSMPEFKNKKTIVFSGSLQPWHGLEYAIRAMPRILTMEGDVHLIVVGDGPQRKYLTSLCRELGISSNVSFLGFQPYYMVPRYLSIAGVLIAPFSSMGSRIAGCPLKIMEYMSVGRPIVSTSLEWVTEILENDKTALLVPQTDPRSLAEPVVRLLEDKVLAERLGANARKKAVEELSWTQVAARYREVYEKVL